MKSKIEHLICDRSFSYLHPYFYNHPYALRCELGIGEDAQQYMENAKHRATEIYHILFPRGADAIIFNYWIIDHSDSGEAEKRRLEEIELELGDSIHVTLQQETNQLRFLLKYQGNYRHHVVRNLPTYDNGDEEAQSKVKRNRIVCYADGTDFDYTGLIDLQINGNGHEISFISFENECILSIYDDRGCDIVFATHEKMAEFYHRLQPYFLEYDVQEMEKRYNG